MNLPDRKPILATLLTLAMFPVVLANADEEAIRNDAEKVLKDFSPTSEADISVELEEGVATMTGTVENLPTRRLASEAVATVVGVEAIVNRLRIREQEIDDRSIETNIDRLFSLNRANKDGAIEWRVNDGVVTLNGNVSSFAMSRLAEEMTESVAGVRSVVNNFRIKPLAQANDDELRQHLALLLEQDPWITEELVTATVDDGVVTLRGAVDTISERERLITAAQIYGVSHIDATDLVVSPQLRTDYQRAHRPLFRTDEDLATALREAIKQDPRLLSSDIEVTVLDGLVTLDGSVNHIGGKMAAAEVASELPGAEGTLNFLLVAPDEPIDDAALETALRELLTGDALLSGSRIEVTVEDGEVTLSGMVENTNQRRRAVEVCMFAHGARKITSKLRVDWSTPEEYTENVEDDPS